MASYKRLIPILLPIYKKYLNIAHIYTKTYTKHKPELLKTKTPANTENVFIYA